MSGRRWPAVLSVHERAKLLVSLHDVSPVTLADSATVVELVRDAGIPSSALTVLVVPFHEQRTSLDDHAPSIAFLRGLASQGATLVAHGYTHRMTGRPRTPWRWLATRWFARGQGELAVADAQETSRRLDAAEAIFARSGLTLTGFVPPAWLLSPAAAAAVAQRGFAFVERMGGIIAAGTPHLLARRLVGWGSLSWIEALATSAHAWLQARRSPADTRVAIHPPDVRHARTRRSIERTLRRLASRMDPTSYGDYLATRA